MAQGTGRKAGGGLARPVQPSADLAKITGNDPLPRSQVVSKVWDHIRKNNLQNPQNKREIVADATLKPIFGGKDRVSMFEMNKHLSNHLKEASDPLEHEGLASDRGSLFLWRRQRLGLADQPLHRPSSLSRVTG
jgi:hypothetical protein